MGERWKWHSTWPGLSKVVLSLPASWLILLMHSLTCLELSVLQTITRHLGCLHQEYKFQPVCIKNESQCYKKEILLMNKLTRVKTCNFGAGSIHKLSNSKLWNQSSCRAWLAFDGKPMNNSKMWLIALTAGYCVAIHLCTHYFIIGRWMNQGWADKNG